MTIVKRSVERVVVEESDVAKCDRCGVEGEMPQRFTLPDGWLALKTADRLAVTEEYCSDDCLAQAVAQRVGKVLA